MLAGQLLSLDLGAIPRLFFSLVVLCLTISVFSAVRVSLRNLHRNRVRQAWWQH
jgi:hypothetical protein